MANLRPWLRGRTVLCVAHHPRVFARLGATRVVTLGAGGTVLRDERLRPHDTPDAWNHSSPSGGQ
jgi:ABC-type bacteriocin/lantibiotic exporter with double-glycine peptidase domain